MQNSNNMINLFIVILSTFIVFSGIMFFTTDLETLSKSYTEIVSENPSQAILLMIITVIGLGIITFFSKYFFEKDFEEQDYVNKFLEHYLNNKV
jgi:divalent metal cation (Fe/Co/Zn/Cd) transporter